MREIFEHCLMNANQVAEELAKNAFISKQFLV
jgi:hypothetical protein